MKTIVGTDILYAASLLRQEWIVGVPTETVYGLAANALSPAAVIKIFTAKNRPYFDPLIVHCISIDHIQPYVAAIPDWASTLGRLFSPGPITFLLPKKQSIPDIVTSGLPQVGIRIPSHTVIRELLSHLDFPLAAPSANPFGYISPTSAKHVFDQLEGKLPYILDGGESSVGVESTVVGEENGKLIIYRVGGVSIEEIESAMGKVEYRLSTSQPMSPGALDSHYAPKTPLHMFTDVNKLPHDNNIGLIMYMTLLEAFSESQQRVLTPSGDLKLAAQNLFKIMRELDGMGFDAIYAERVPQTGLGMAINDRLKRASINILSNEI